jgi:hypothetical protein
LGWHGKEWKLFSIGAGAFFRKVIIAPPILWLRVRADQRFGVQGSDTTMPDQRHAGGYILRKKPFDGVLFFGS